MSSLHHITVVLVILAASVTACAGTTLEDDELGTARAAVTLDAGPDGGQDAGGCLDLAAQSTTNPDGTTACTCPDGTSGGSAFACIAEWGPTGNPEVTVEPSNEPLPNFPHDNLFAAPPGGSSPNVTMTCVESLAMKQAEGFVAWCDSNGDLVCSGLTVCAYHYRDPDNCWSAGCSGNDTVQAITTTAVIPTNASQLWLRQTLCAGLVSGAQVLASARCLAQYSVSCSANWPTPTPTGVCMWGPVPASGAQ